MNTPKTVREKICPDARALLPGYVEGELSPIELRLVQGHLDICSACRTEEAAFRRSLSALRAAPKPSHGDLYAGLSAKLERLERKQPIRPLRLQWAGGLACLLLAVGVGATVVSRTYFSSNNPSNPSNAAVPAPIAVVVQSKGGESKVARVPQKPVVPNVAPVIEDPVTLPLDGAQEQGSVDSQGNLDQPKYYAEDPRPREQKRSQRPIKQVDDSLQYADIKKVRDSQGRTVDDIINEMKKNNRYVIDKTAVPPVEGGPKDPVATGTAASAPIKPVAVDDPALPDVAMIVPEKEKQMDVGEKIVTSSRAEGYTKSGKLALIRLTAEAVPKSNVKPKLKKELGKDALDEGR